MDVGLFIPCFVDQLAPGVGIATAEVLERAGCRVDYDPDQTCCGQPFLNLGLGREASRLARLHLERFARYEAVVCPSASCVATVRHHYDELGVGTGLNFAFFTAHTRDIRRQAVQVQGTAFMGCRH